MINFALFTRNAKACENAKHPRCTCACGGKLHGASHAGKLQELWDAYVEREQKKAEEQEPQS